MVIGEASDVIDGIFAVWLGLSGAALVLLHFVFRFHLVGLGVNVRRLSAWNPRYLANQYLQWCADHGQRPGPWLRGFRWLLILLAAISSCGTTQADRYGDIRRCTDRVVHEAGSPALPEEVICDRDSDCIISNRNLDNPCEHCWVEPYAISKPAPWREVGEYRTCHPIDYACGWPTCPDKFVAVCVQHACERKLKE